MRVPSPGPDPVSAVHPWKARKKVILLPMAPWPRWNTLKGSCDSHLPEKMSS